MTSFIYIDFCRGKQEERKETKNKRLWKVSLKSILRIKYMKKSTEVKTRLRQPWKIG